MLVERPLQRPLTGTRDLAPDRGIQFNPVTPCVAGWDHHPPRVNVDGQREHTRPLHQGSTSLTSLQGHCNQPMCAAI